MPSERRSTLRPRVVTRADAAADPGLKEDTYFQKVVRYIPGEVAVAYTTASGLVIAATGIPTMLVLWIVIAGIGVLSIPWLYCATRVPGKRAPFYQICVGVVAYCCWVFALHGNLLFPGWYNPLYGALVLIFFTLAVPLIELIFMRR